MPEEVDGGSPLRHFADMTGAAHTAPNHNVAWQEELNVDEPKSPWSSLHRHVTAAVHEENDEGYNVRKVSAWLRDSFDEGSRNHNVRAGISAEGYTFQR